MWGSDLPHPEGTFPFTRYWIRTRYHNVPEDETRKLLGFNAARCYNLDTVALAPLVEQIGVTEDDIYGDSEMEAAPF